MSGNTEFSASLPWHQPALHGELGTAASLNQAPDNPTREAELRSEERTKERARIARELHDTVLQGFFAVSILLHQIAEETPSNSPGKQSVTDALHVVKSVVEEGRRAIDELRTSNHTIRLEDALCSLRELMADRSVQYRVLVTGRTAALPPEALQQLYFIAREAVTNCLLHSQATIIEAEVHYSRSRLRMIVRDDGIGVDSQKLHDGQTKWGLERMRERAGNIEAGFKMWSRKGTGTEIEVTVPRRHSRFLSLSQFHPRRLKSRMAEPMPN